MMKFCIIAAIVAETNAIGSSLTNNLPWENEGLKIKKDMKHFKELTFEYDKLNAIIMGRNTWESFKGIPLAGRINVVITSKDLKSLPNGVLVYKSLDEALRTLKSFGTVNKVFVIGGQQLYKEAIEHENCETIYLTKIYNLKLKYEQIYDVKFPTEAIENNEKWLCTEVEKLTFMCTKDEDLDERYKLMIVKFFNYNKK